MTSLAQPRHVAIIMDGNGRWAHTRGLERTDGHRQGLEAVRETMLACREAGIANLTLFAFSTDNWRRPRREINVLLELLSEGLHKHLPTLLDNAVRIRFLGDLSSFPVAVRATLDRCEAATTKGTGLNLQVALNYSGRWDILEAVRQLADTGCDLSEVTEADIDAHVTTAGLPPPDLLIRTSGELRLSNFMLWQAAYTELYFTEALWPDFGRADFAAALADFAQRDRRFGTVKATETLPSPAP